MDCIRRKERLLQCQQPGPFWQEETLYYSDLGATDYWQSKISLMKSCGIEVQMFDYLEANATENERKRRDMT